MPKLTKKEIKQFVDSSYKKKKDAQTVDNYKLDNELSTRGRALCYGALNITFDMEHFDPVAETHYTATSHNPYNKRSVNMKAYWDNLASYIIESLNESI